MNTLRHFKIITLATLLVAGLGACDQPGPAEQAGKQIDRTVDQAGKKINETVDKVGATVDKVGGEISDQGVKAGVAVEDTEITAKVKAAIFAEPGLKTLQISVDTIKGVVTLSGSVDSLENSQRAKALAAAVAGVAEVDNRLVTK